MQIEFFVFQRKHFLAPTTRLEILMLSPLASNCFEDNNVIVLKFSREIAGKERGWGATSTASASPASSGERRWGRCRMWRRRSRSMRRAGQRCRLISSAGSWPRFRRIRRRAQSAGLTLEDFQLSRPGLTLEDFQFFLFSDELNPPIGTQVHQDMTAPLSHYYIYTGHNSYLTGNQLSSDCSDVPIINSLQSGVRVIELDLWPNSTKDNIDILHGRTLTTPVDLIKCLKSIKEYAFIASPYPVIITLEDHLTPDLQAKVAKMVTETFGDMLYFPDSDYVKEFPSPEALKKRIIISTKPPKEYLEAKSFKKKDDDSPKEKNSDDEEWGREAIDKTEADFDDGQSEHPHNEDEADDDDHKIKHDLAPEYRRLITITAGKPKGSVRDALKVDPDRVKRVSLSEQELEKVAASHGADVIRFTQKNLLRIYPKGTRFNSSNYNPLIGWMHGAQMVAFNMQGYGRSLWRMQGFYRANGGCGYVKKPHFLLNNGPHGEVFNPKTKLHAKKILKVKVYMGDGWRMDFKSTYFDTCSPPDFYTRVGIAGVPADCTMKKTRTIEDDWMPVWDKELVFPLTVPELALLRIEVHEYDMSDKDDFGGQTCLPVSELKPGIRAVPLFTRKGVKYRSVRLLVRFEFLTDCFTSVEIE